MDTCIYEQFFHKNIINKIDIGIANSFFFNDAYHLLEKELFV